MTWLVRVVTTRTVSGRCHAHRPSHALAELPLKVRHRANRHLDEDRAILLDGLTEGTLQRVSSGRLDSWHAERSGEPDEVRIAEIRPDGAPAERLLLDALDVPERAVVEHHDGHADIVLDSGRQLLHVEHEATVAVDRDDRAVRIADLRTERRREATPERPLIPRGNVGARRVERHASPRPIRHLG